MAKQPDCLDLVQRSVPDMTRQELDEVIGLLKAKQQTKMARGLNAEQAAKEAGEELSNELKMAAKIERRNAAINRRIRLQGVDNIVTNWSDDPVEGVLAMLYGSPKARPGSRNSANAAQSANFRRYVGGLQSELERAGLWDVFRRGEMDLDVSRALWSLDDDVTLRALPSSAVEVAKILDKYRELARLEANRAGAWIGKAKNYITRQTHAPDRILRAGLQVWKDYILPRLDIEKMFPEGVPPDMNTWLTEAFANLTTGVRPRSSLEVRAERMAAFKGPRNLAKRISQDRTFYFKSADAWFEYNQEFGHGNLRETFINDLHRRAEATGLIQVLGTNPEYNLDAIVRAIEIQLSRTDPKKLAKFKSKSRNGEKFENALRELSGYTRTIASSNLATVGSFTRMWNILTTMGGAVMSAIGDVPIRASALRFQGQSYLGQLSKGIIAPIERLVSGAGSPERQAILHAAGYFNDIALRNMVSRFSPDENLPGKIQGATNTFFKWNLLGQWTDEQRRSTIEAMANFLGGLRELSWNQLSERNRRALERFNITDKEWDLVRRGVDEDDDGNHFLTPEKIRQLPLDHFTEFAANRIDEIKRGLLERIQKRMKADERERGWVDSRHEKFTETLDKANARLIELAERREGRLLNRQEILNGRIDEQVRKAETKADETRQTAFDEFVDNALALNKEIGDIRSRLEDIKDWWKLGFDFELAPRYGKRVIRKVGVEEGTLKQRQTQAAREYRKELAELRRQLDKANKSVNGLREKLEASAADEMEGRQADLKEDIAAHYETFNEAWAERFEDLKKFMEEMDDRAKARAEDTAGDIDSLGSRIQRMLEDSRANLADRLQRFYADEVDSAIITPDARATAFVRRGTQAGTTMGEVFRLFWQFKGYAIGILQRGFMREFYGYDKGRGGRLGMPEIRGLGLLLAGTMAFGYASLALKDLLRGRTARPLNDIRTYRDSMAQGGSLGVYGDFLLGSQVRMGGGFLSAIGGPTVGKLDDVTAIYGAVTDGNDPRALMLKTAIQNIPYNNLFYTKMAVDYFLMYEMQEAMNPGYLRRYEQRVTEATGSEWWLPPSEAAR